MISSLLRSLMEIRSLFSSTKVISGHLLEWVHSYSVWEKSASKEKAKDYKDIKA